ncbi:MAG: helix-turn-helix transcriptional regulator [Nitrospirae bacterium]|nr:helix-turn-helix transcriptional regulator [Magnetococcales bacterium]HAT48846.1 transcriptional regulator [Alphaproteobacteria bacterium]
MTLDRDDFAVLVKIVRHQLEMSQEELAYALGVSFATVNRWENAKTTPSRLARRQFDEFCTKMTRAGRLSPKDCQG